MPYELKRATVEWGEVRLVVQEADGLMGMRRQMMRQRAFAPDPKKKGGMQLADEDEAVATLRLVVFPDYVACLVESQGLPDPLTFEAFVGLPEELLNAWGMAVYQVNPAWNPLYGPEADKAAQKKAPTSGESSPGSSSKSRRTRRPS